MSNPSDSFWSGKRVFVTGHTGFKGGWLSLWLQSMGAEVCGFALPPQTDPAFFDVAGIANGMRSEIGDIRDYNRLTAVLRSFKPDVVLHLAAQPLVRRSYQDPLETYSTNIMGTLNLLEVVRKVGGARAVVNVTSDKCYENREWVWGYREDEPMGGYDPYSNSKGCSELISSAYRRSFYKDAGIALATARAGNVIGGGDWSEDRLVPDMLRAFERKEPVLIRNPNAVRPWQHVLEPVSGYLVLAERLYERGDSFAEAWNFGPQDLDARPVQWIVERLAGKWGNGADWRVDKSPQPHEANYLKLDISKARQNLPWQPRWSLETALDHIVVWQRSFMRGADMAAVSLAQIDAYQNANE
jgi:CDP-glucose 4,6-dehydratase